MASQTAYQTLEAKVSDTQWIIDLSARVQAALIASGSLQELTFLSPATLSSSILAKEIFILQETATQGPIGSVTICPFDPEAEHGSWDWMTAESSGSSKKWFLHTLMLEPTYQGKGLGMSFLQEALRMLESREGEGLLLLDCWAGNDKLRAFYGEAGFRFVGVFPQGDYEIAVFDFQIGGSGG